MKKRQFLLPGILVGAQTLLLSATASAGQPGPVPPGLRHLNQQSQSASVEDKLQKHRVANWEKSHAKYLHDLESASLDKSNGKTHQAKMDLIDARLYISYAEADHLDLGKIANAREDLKKSSELLQRAATQADPGIRSQIESLSETLQMSKLTGKNSLQPGDNMLARNRYTEIKSGFDSLIKQI